MGIEIFATLEKKIETLLQRYDGMRRENEELKGENRRLAEERQLLKRRIDDILAKLERV